MHKKEKLNKKERKRGNLAYSIFTSGVLEHKDLSSFKADLEKAEQHSQTIRASAQEEEEESSNIF